jgi:hypothetical protein
MIPYEESLSCHPEVTTMKMISARRTFLQATAAFLMGGAKLFAGSLRRLLPNRQEQRAAERGRKLGVGTISLKGPSRVEVNTRNGHDHRYR